MKKKSRIYRGLANLFLFVLVAFGIVAYVAQSWAGKVNELLGVSDSTFQRSEDPEDYTYRSDFETGSDLIQAEIDLDTRLEAEGAVALKGQPAVNGTNVTLFGMRSGEKMQFGGSMGSLIESSQVVTLEQALTENGFSVNPTMTQFYKDMEANYSPERAAGGNVVSEPTGTTINEVPQSEYASFSADTYKDYSDAAIIVLGRDAGESCCFYPGEDGIATADEFTGSPTGNILSLSNQERDLVNYVKNQGFSKVIVLINSAVPMEIDELVKDDGVDSIVWIGNPGAYGTYGIAQLLSGAKLPSGHLPDTYAVNSALSPAAQNYGVYLFTNAAEIETTNNNGLRSDWYLVENESIYIGYKYYETRYFDVMTNQGNAAVAGAGQAVNDSSVWNYDNEVSYSFGYGEEGSTFSEEITDVQLDWTGETQSTVTVHVTNTGDTAAKHAVQLYVSVPYTSYDKQNGIEKSAIQLVGYAKTGESEESTYADYVTLAAGASEDVTISFNATDIFSYDDTYEHDGVTGAWHLEAGDYYFATGNGAHDAVQAVLAKEYTELADDVTYTGDVYVENVAADQYITESNGTTIQNELGDGDLNSYDAGVTVTELTRSDWNGTFPEEITSITATDDMVTLLRNATYDQTAEDAAYTGETTFTQGADNGVQAVDLVGLAYDDPLYETVIDEVPMDDLVNQYLAYLGAIEEINMPKEQRSDSPLGFVGKIGQFTEGSIYEVAEDDPAYGHFTDVHPSGEIVAASFSHKLAEEEGRIVGNESLWTGYNAWFGPGLNIHRTPYNGRNIEYYSEDPILTGTTAADVIRKAVSYGVVVNEKHFAFNDQETNRDGLAVFISEQAGRENELKGFQLSFRDGGCNGVMTAFNRLGCTHVGADKNLMNGILRGEWGFQGQIITDSVKSAAYFLPRETMMAANNEMLGGSNNGATWNFTTATVQADPVIWNGVRESYHHKLYTYVNSNLLNGVTSTTSTAGATPMWVIILYIVMGFGLCGFVVCVAMYVRNIRKEGRA